MNMLDKTDAEMEEIIASVSDALIFETDACKASEIIGKALSQYTVYDLQYIGGYIKLEVDKLPNPYKNQYRPFSTDLMDKYSEIIIRYRNKRCDSVCGFDEGDAELRKKYWEDTKVCCFRVPDNRNGTNYMGNNPARHFFYRLVYAHVMFLDKGFGHPVGLPFPGGFTVRREGDKVYCPIRDKEKDLEWALCNYCPAEQDPNYK